MQFNIPFGKYKVQNKTTCRNANKAPNNMSDEKVDSK